MTAPAIAAAAGAAPALHLDAVSVRLGGRAIVEGVTAAVPAGSSTAIVGPNGAGKTTLLRAILGELPCTGRIVVDGSVRSRIGYVPQRVHIDRAAPLLVVELLHCGLHPRWPLWLRGRRADPALLAALEEVEAAHLAQQRVGSLSGGELQRVLLALALLRRPRLLILDEPAASVDAAGEHLLCEVLARLRARHGFTQLMISHDLGVVAAHADHVWCVNRRLVAAGAPRAVLTRTVLTATYGPHLGLADPCDLPGGVVPHHGSCSHAAPPLVTLHGARPAELP